MSRVPELLDYTRLSIDDIEDAINSHFIKTKNIPLHEYGDLIRGLKQGNVLEVAMIPIKISISKKSKLINNFTIYDFQPIVCPKIEILQEGGN